MSLQVRIHLNLMLFIVSKATVLPNFFAFHVIMTERKKQFYFKIMQIKFLDQFKFKPSVYAHHIK